MGYNFPTSPTDGHVHWFGDGIPTYVYSSAKGAWTRRKGTADRRNRIVNPCFHINDQNNLTDGSNVSGLTMAEGFYANYTTDVGVYRGQRLAISTPGGSKHRLRLSITTADPTLTAGEWLTIYHGIEANKMVDFQYGTSAAKWSVLSFGWKAPAGTYCAVMRNGDSTRSYVYPFTVPAGKANTDIRVTCVIPPCTTGTWTTDNTRWANINWVICNANYTSSLYTWLTGNYAGANTLTNTFYQTVGNTVELFDVGLYMDPNCTGLAPPFEPTHPEDDWQDCLRYWYRCYRMDGSVNTTSQGIGWASHYVPMRIAPAATVVGSLRTHDISVTPNVSSVANYQNHADSTALLVNQAGATYTLGRPFRTLVDGQSAAYIAMNAR